MTLNTSDEKDQIPLFGETTPPPATAPSPPPRPTPKKRDEPAPKQQPARKAAPPGKKTTKEVTTSGQVPEGDVRLTANIREDLHLRLKIAAARQRTTIGEIIEDLVERHIPPA